MVCCCVPVCVLCIYVYGVCVVLVYIYIYKLEKYNITVYGILYIELA